MTFVITKHDYILELLEDIIQQGAQARTDVIVCSAREDFVGQILAELYRHHLENQPEGTSPEDDEDDNEGESRIPSPTHILLSKALHVLNSSQLVHLYFCPTITLFRGFLSGYGTSLTTASQSNGSMVVLNLLAMHHGTSEFNLQGLSQTLASAVSAAHRTGRDLRLVECKDIKDPANPSRGWPLWEAEVQLLSAAIRIGEAGQNWGRRTISVMKIASRWFKVDDSREARHEERGATAQETGASEEEMLV
ncbi:hypothetical protein H2200_012675 [Cladophialophora chaetospira]|uniref:Uncharacterized protein n=1 Tax=Cladophialophora chaetospira TaxID=386627 RepID=A0AA38WXE8_9EURO|nr:hypothetical protein H2200_012675 [Cladophialophora chaetospira]